MGYNMPSQYHLYQDKKDATKHTLEVNYMHAFEDSLTEDYTVKVILPEGATDIDIEVPQNLKNFVDKIYLDKYFGTLDYFGRPMIVIKQSNAVYQLQDEILRVNYRFDNSTSLYLEPLFVFGMIFSIYLFAIIYSRLSLDLKNKNELKEEHAKQE
jgi:oligosaccharyltransferase complex subunit alpha (ribophorin I)